ncbi:MAG TPA: hypothetical protein VJ834_03455 [Burkholderiales bacterium]|nr:hypothetical protein [Burkholderiales bacterium]
MPSDFSKHAFKIRDHIPILEPQHLDSAICKKPIARFIVPLRLIVIMCSAIKLDSQPLQWTVKIEDVRAATVLAAKFSSGKLRAL